MTTPTSIDWILCLAWSLGRAMLTALVGLTPVNAGPTYDSIRLTGSRVHDLDRWVGRCKACGLGLKVEGSLATGRVGNIEERIVVAGTSCYRTADQGSNPTAVSLLCCSGRVRLKRVFDSHKPNRPRHECNAKCMASTGPACECKCGGKNHGRSLSG